MKFVAGHLGLWAAPPILRCHIKVSTLPTNSSEDFMSPTNRNMQEAQESDSTSRQPSTHIIDGIWGTKDRLIWTPDDADLRQLFFPCMIAHSDTYGRCLSDVAAATLR